MLKTMFVFGYDDDVDIDVSRLSGYEYSDYEQMEKAIVNVLPATKHEPKAWVVQRFGCDPFKPVSYRVGTSIVGEQMEAQFTVVVSNTVKHESYEYRLDVATKDPDLILNAPVTATSMVNQFDNLPQMTKVVDCSPERVPELVA